MQSDNGWIAPARPPVQGASRAERQRVLGLIMGPVFLLIGGFFGWADLADRVHFAGADRATAVVVRAEYVKPQAKQGGSLIEVQLSAAAGGETVAVDDAGTAPGGLAPGQEVTVLVDGRGPVHVLFPSQLGWGKALVGLGFTVVGLAGTAVGATGVVRRIRGKRTP